MLSGRSAPVPRHRRPIGSDGGARDAPRIEVVGDGSQTFTFVPSHIAFVVGTLLTNSSVATLRHHHRQQAAGRIAPGEPLPLSKQSWQ